MGLVDLPPEFRRFVSPDGKRADCSVFRGRVVGGSRWSETHVTTTSGGVSGQIGGTLTVTPATVSSYVDEKHEFFVSDGSSERSYRFTNINFPVREGHALSIAHLRVRGIEWPIAAYNHTLGSQAVFPIHEAIWSRLIGTMLGGFMVLLHTNFPFCMSVVCILGCTGIDVLSLIMRATGFWTDGWSPSTGLVHHFLLPDMAFHSVRNLVAPLSLLVHVAFFGALFLYRFKGALCRHAIGRYVKRLWPLLQQRPG